MWVKMKIKEFFKLSWTKIILTIVLTLLSSNVIIGYRKIINGFAYGFPFIFYRYACTYGLVAGQFGGCLSTNYLDYLLFDLIFWFLISCLIIYIYNKIKKSKKNKK